MQQLKEVMSPPLVRFTTEPEEDRAATEERGHVVYKDVIYAYITPVGAKDTVKREVKEWLLNLKDQVQQGRFPEEWLEKLHRGLEQYKKDNSMPEIGTPLRVWGGVTPAQLQNLISANITTLEGLAEANEEALARYGIGGRELKERAQAAMKERSQEGSVAIENAALKLKLREAEVIISDLENKLKVANKQLKALQPAEG